MGAGCNSRAMIRLTAAFVVGAIDGGASAGQPADAPAPAPFELAPTVSPTGDVTFRPVRDLKQQGGKTELKLQQATIANTNDWPVSFRASFARPNGEEETCTAVLIGPQVLLTAAHCVPPSRRIGYGVPGGALSATCARHDA